jgi:hypothetical protein
MKNKPDAEQSIGKSWSDIGGFRPNLTQPSRIVLQGNLTKSDGEDVLSTTLLKDESPGTDAGTKVSIVRSGVEVRSSAAAEENDEGMACRIRTGRTSSCPSMKSRARFNIITAWKVVRREKKV